MNKKYLYLGFALSFLVILDSRAAEPQKSVGARKFQSNVLNDLNVFRAQGKDSKATLFAAIDRTSTVTGGESLKQKVAHPKTDIHELRKNQEFTKALLEGEKLFEFLDGVIKSVDDNKIIAGLADKDAATKAFHDSLYATWWKRNPKAIQYLDPLVNQLFSLRVYFLTIGLDLRCLIQKKNGDAHSLFGLSYLSRI